MSIKNTVRKILSAKSVEADMANIGPKAHNFGIEVKLNILQPGNRKIQHGPRIKVFKIPKISFSVSLNKDENKVKIIGDPLKVIKRNEVKSLLDKIKKYRMAFLMMWYDQGMTQEELLALMKRVNTGESLDKDLDLLLK